MMSGVQEKILFQNQLLYLTITSYEVLDQQGLAPGNSVDLAGGPPQSSPHVEPNMFTNVRTGDPEDGMGRL